MLDKVYAQYGKAKSGGDECRDCRWFKMPGRCEIVEGKIEPSGWCRFFHQKGSRRVPAWVQERARA